MSHHGERRYLLCYDIADPRRQARVRRRAKQDGVALQYSVFDCRLTEARLRWLVADLRHMIDAREDDVRIYGVHVEASIAQLGVSPCPDGVQVFHNPERQ